jgi:UDP-3-O-[3-hydroxymyristoyl] glucosamine N-acyltransferase
VATYTLNEIASRVAGSVVGNAACRIGGVRPLDEAGPEDLSFLANARYRRAAADSKAGALLTSSAEGLPGRNLILVDNPYTALAAVMRMFHAPSRPAPGISPQASIGPDVALGRDVSIAPLVSVGRGCALGDEVALMPGVVLGDGVAIGRQSLLHPNVVVYPGCRIGERVVIHAGAVIGSDGFGFGEEAGGRAKIPQIGVVHIGDDVEIGANCTIDRATFGSTVIGNGCRIDNLVQIGHNVQVGDGSVLVAQSGIAGSTKLGRSVILAGQSGISGHLKIGDRSIVGAKSAVLRDLEPSSFVVGHPAVDHREWKRTQAALRRLPELVRRVLRLEARGATAPPATGRRSKLKGRRPARGRPAGR